VTPEEPLSNVIVEGVEVDFCFPERRLVVEIDDPSHGRERSQREDALERRALEAAGYRSCASRTRRWSSGRCWC
jgi:very-short-patch-repair endonuclease